MKNKYLISFSKENIEKQQENFNHLLAQLGKADAEEIERGPKKSDKVGQSWTNCPAFLLIF